MSDKIKQKICYFDLADIYQEQNWLEDMARRGLLLTYTGYLIYDFAYGEPTERRYRILPEKRKKIEQEELDIYESCGWTCVRGTHASTVFYTDDQNVSEPFTDAVTEKKYYVKRLLYTFITTIALTFCILMNLDLNTNGFVFNPIEAYYQLADKPSPIIYIYAVMYPMLVLFELVFIFRYTRLIWKLKRETFKRTAGFKARRYVNMILINAIIVLMVGLFIYVIFVPDKRVMTSSFKEALAYNDAELVRFSEFDPSAWDEVRANMIVRDGNKNIDNPDITYETSYDRNVMMTKMSSEDLSAPSRTDKRDKSGGNLMYHVQLYKAKSAKIAACFMPSNIENQLEGMNFDVSKKRIRDMRFKYDGLDYAAYIRASEKDEFAYELGTQMLFLRKGNKYVVIAYSGPIDLKSKVGLFAAKM
ncbi:DUF2812 domain-containing protein [Mogibacterium diversum]|uniref:DUF2812 domain-containing protein n=1 Tax=Mogibacterium diversum TaxID=114527 RepID=UPI0027BB1BED|nr:DUF2812 domain-containing protein [Mogibacterium diversum]